MSTIDELFASIDEVVKRGVVKPPPKPAAKPVPVTFPKLPKIPPPTVSASSFPEGISPEHPATKVITSAPVTEWETQVRPVLESGTTLLHFQTRPPNKGVYYKYNLTTTTKVFEEIKAAIAAGKPCRPSFYGSATKYLICTRINNTLVDVPGIAQLDVSGMAGAVPNSGPSSSPTVEIPEKPAPEEFEEELEEEDEEDMLF